MVRCHPGADYVESKYMVRTEKVPAVVMAWGFCNARKGNVAFYLLQKKIVKMNGAVYVNALQTIIHHQIILETS